ncbi:ROK family transcriptional regulator [Acerihabitans arboris]|uniref:ROK family protein n=1 Tax=Acerihabitans arboris TaxID=2691583 RepID=A0A845SKW8_9GAMM|nr:ROK family protein [Acerihabitans arboris]NDL64032.1 ROK family protein [Acerihabitans arboris]
MTEPGKGPALLRQYNEKHVLSFLRQQRVSSRLDIARALSLSKNTISLIVDDFIARGYVAELGVAQSNAIGRPKIYIALLPDKMKAAGIMVERQQLHWAVYDYFSDVIEQQTLALDTTEPGPVLAEIARIIQWMYRRYPALIGIGVGFPGIIDPIAGVMHISSHLGWQQVDLLAALDKSVPPPVGVMNIVKAAALVSRQRGAGLPGAEPCFYLRIAEGIGGTLLTEHGVYYGGSWTAGEVGHLNVAPDGPLCSCGQRGCLESLIGLSAVNAQLELLQPGLRWANRAQAPRLAEQVIARAGELLGKALSQIIHLVNPRTLLIDCAYNTSPLFTEQVLSVARRNTLAFAYGHTQIRFLSHSYDPAQGLALAMIQRFEKIDL